MCLPLAVMWDVSAIPDFRATLFPIGVCLISISLLILIFAVQLADLRKPAFASGGFLRFVNTNIYENVAGFNNQLYYYLSILGYLAMNFIFGFPIASVLFINLFILFHDKRGPKNLSFYLALAPLDFMDPIVFAHAPVSQWFAWNIYRYAVVVGWRTQLGFTKGTYP